MPVVHGDRPGHALAYGDTGVIWEARLIQPKAMVEGSTQDVVIEVAGPVLLSGPASVKIGSVTAVLEWQGQADQTRRGVATLRPRVGVHRVLVQVGDVILSAGWLKVSPP